jgi:hypothetical protein
MQALTAQIPIRRARPKRGRAFFRTKCERRRLRRDERETEWREGRGGAREREREDERPVSHHRSLGYGERQCGFNTKHQNTKVEWRAPVEAARDWRKAPESLQFKENTSVSPQKKNLLQFQDRGFL